TAADGTGSQRESFADGISPARSVMRYQSPPITLLLIDKDVLGLAKSRCALRHRVQHGLKIGRRTANHRQDLCSCRLPLQRLLRLVEQPDVLDGDHRLIGEGLQERDL